MNSMSEIPSSAIELDARAWGDIMENYKQPNNLRAVFEISVTLALFVALWAAMYFAFSVSYLLTLVLAVPAAAMLMRIFMIQHDCGHGSFVGSRFANQWLGRGLGVLTITPYDYWQRSHSIHHASSGSLDHRGMGDITTLTVEEYKSRGVWGRILYRAYRNPITLFVIGPAYMFLLQHRLPVGMMKIGWKPWMSTMGTNLGIILVSAAVIWLVGWKAFFFIQIPVTLLAASIGVWLFFVQHQYEETVWDNVPEWDRKEAALHGSSHYDLPGILKWITGHIGVHHVHHLCSHIPSYRLPEVLRDYPELKDFSRITLFESFKCARLALWDQKSYRLLTFRDALSAV